MPITDDDVKELLKAAGDGEIERGRVFLIGSRAVSNTKVRHFFGVKLGGQSKKSLWVKRAIKAVVMIGEQAPNALPASGGLAPLIGGAQSFAGAGGQIGGLQANSNSSGNQLNAWRESCRTATTM